MRKTANLILSALILLAANGVAADAPLAPAVADIRDALRRGDVEAAVEAGEFAVASRENDALAFWWAGRAYGQQTMQANVLMKPKWASRTRAAFEKAVELDPAHVQARFDLLNYYLMAPRIVGGGRDKADLQAAAIAELNASMGKAAEARLASADEQAERAEALYVEALGLDGDNLSARTHLAAIAAERKNWQHVRLLWQQQLERERHHALAHYQLGRAAAICGEQLDSGLGHLDRFIADNEIPEQLSIDAAHWRRGQILEKLGRRDEAIDALSRAIDDANIGELARADLDRLRKG